MSDINESIQLKVITKTPLLSKEKNNIVLTKVENGQIKSNNGRKSSVKLTHLIEHHNSNVNIKFKDLSYFVSSREGKKRILSSISGEFRSSELNGIMGPSGAGKSTLMNILAGSSTANLKGQILINGQERNLRRFRKLSCYIMQDDQLLPYLTVKEAMLVSANLKLGKNYSRQDKDAIINEIIDALGLSTSSNTMTRNLSGGQKKRLSIALELVNNPPIMFFDEPTSGLDSSTCFQLISLLKSLARGGRTIICTIHQPSARLFEMFNNLYMLAEGKCIYQGSVLEVVPFLFKNGFACPQFHNPADYIMEVCSGEHGDAIPKLVSSMEEKMNEKMANSEAENALERTAHSSTCIHGSNESALEDHESLTMNLTDESLGKCCMKGKRTAENFESEITFATSFCTQFWILLKRSFKTILRDQTLTQMRLVAHLSVGAIIGMIYYDIGNDASKVISNAGCIFFIILFTMFTAMMPTILTFPTEMSVFVREYLNYWYSMKAYYLAKTVADVPFQVIFSSIYVIVVYMLTSQPIQFDRMGMFVLICVLTSLVAQSIGILIGAGLSVEAGTFLGPVTTIPTILFSGFFVNFDVIPSYLRWLSYISYVRFGFEGAMVSIYGYGREKMDCDKMYCHFRLPSKFLEEFSMKDANFWVNAGALTIIFIGLRIVAYFVLRVRVRLYTR